MAENKTKPQEPMIRKYCYAMVSKRTNRLIVNGATLPIFWNKKVAEQVLLDFPKASVRKMYIDEIESSLHFISSKQYSQEQNT